jgi:hypothetical protein
MNEEKGTATIEYVLQVCDDIYSDVRRSYKNTDKINTEFCDDLHSEMIKKYKDFSLVYPIILRHIVYEKKYYSEVMKKFLMHVSNHHVKTRDDSLVVQAEYMVLQMKHETPRLDKRRYEEYRDYVVKELRDNDKKLEACIKEANEEMKKDKEMGQQDRRERLREYVLKQLKDTEQSRSSTS